MDTIIEIRAEHGIDETFRNSASSAVLRTIDGLKQNLSRALVCLSEELYSKDTHFILEFVQNADDNTYDNVVPELRIALTGGVLTIECNELGFEIPHIKALCKVGASTKTQQAGYIGEKGIGFKSVFKAANVVKISSRGFTFKFDKHAELGMITPIWDSSIPKREGWTTFSLSLSPETNQQELMKHAKDIKPTLLLFLRRLRTFKIELPSETVTMSREEIKGEVVLQVNRESCPPIEHRYLVSKHNVRTHTDEPKRLGVGESEIVLAFPVNEDTKPIIESQNVHSFLPMRSYGFHFIIQGDFLTLSNREDIHASSRWNLVLRQGIVDCFLHSIDDFISHDKLSTTWMRYLPFSIYDSFFSEVQSEVQSAISQRPVLKSSGGHFCRPTELIILPERYKDGGLPVIPEECLPGSYRYLSSEYDIHQDGPTIRTLGVRDMAISDVASGLAHSRIWSHRPKNHQSSWYETVCRILHEEARIRTVRDLGLVPLKSGEWVKLKHDNLFFDTDESSIPSDLEYNLLVPISWSSDAWRLMNEHGVQKVDPGKIASLINAKHASHSRTLTPPIRLEHARYLFQNKNLKSAPRFRLCDVHGQSRDAGDLYMDRLGAAYSFNDIAPNSCIHPIFLERDESWRTWLKSNVGVRVSPFVSSSGMISPEFIQFLRSRPTREALGALRYYWGSMSPNLLTTNKAALGELEVTCTDGERRMVKDCFLQVHDLQSFTNLPFVDVERPTDYLFLQDLGVITSVNGELYLRQLIHIHQANTPPDGPIYSQVEGIYKQLDARFNEGNNLQLIRAAFDKHPLILCKTSADPPLRWIPLSLAIWKGFSSMRLKSSLHPPLSAYESLFTQCLRLQDAQADVMLEEIRDFVRKHEGQALSETEHKRICGILSDIQNITRYQSNADLSWFNQMKDDPIFPARHPSGGIRLSKLGEIYLPDTRGELAKLFAGHVPFLDLIQGLSYHRIRHILGHAVFKELTDMRRIEKAVSTSVVVNGERVPDRKSALRFTEKLELFQRMLYFSRSHEAAQSPPEVLTQKLSRLTVDRVESIWHHQVLAGASVQVNTDAHIEEADEAIHIVLCESTKDDLAGVCKVLSTYLQLDRSHLFMVVHMDIRGASEFLDDLDIPPLEVILEGMHRGTSLPSVQEPVPQNTLDCRVSTALDLSATYDELQVASLDEPRFLWQSDPRKIAMPTPDDVVLPIHDSRLDFDLPSEQRGFVTPAKHAYEGKSNQALFDASVNPEKINEIAAMINHIDLKEIASFGLHRMGPFNTRSDFATENGKLGEEYVKKLLLNMAPDLSEQRQYGSTADFIYQDEQGVLTKFLFGQEAEKWSGQYPRFHLEVKTTAMSEQKPFHMSQRQLSDAAKYTFPVGTQPNDVYVVVRVSNIRTDKPRHKFFVDPHRCLYQKRMRIESDVEISVLG